MNVEDIIKKNKAKRNSYVTTPTSSNNESLTPKLKYFKNLISRILLAVIFVLFSIIYTNVNSKNKELYKKYVLEDSLSFTKINNLYQKYFGSVDVIKKKEESDSPVFFDSIKYSNLENFKNGIKLTVGANETINVITSGIVVFAGEKEELGNTIIVQGNDGVDIWYSNITDTNIKVYDYIEAGSILGTSNSDYIYLTINKDGKYISYEEYQKLI
ncbi:MAG: M23 family metallopeptidase [Bacilli bacterium]|jgi:stage IV sporulation protein FA|nr:M23 family metallopeptidase [Bacilli bacterium]MCX4254079.1 M23 family metallopeptidase [Bacilli bacterium]